MFCELVMRGERAVSCWNLPNTSCDMMFDGVKNKIEQVQEIYGPLKVSINLLIVNHAFFIYYERFTANKLASWWWQAWTWGKLDITCCKISFNFPNIDFIWVRSTFLKKFNWHAFVNQMFIMTWEPLMWRVQMGVSASLLSHYSGPKLIMNTSQPVWLGGPYFNTHEKLFQVAKTKLHFINIQMLSVINIPILIY